MRRWSPRKAASVGNERDVVLALLASIKAGLERPGALRLSNDERAYLLSVCDRALADHADPLGLGKGAGGQTAGARLLAEAMLVHKRINELGTLRAACEAVGIDLHRDGSKSGAVEKNYRLHRSALVAADRVYAARAAGVPPEPDDIAAILGAKAKGK